MFQGTVERYDLLNRLLSLGADFVWRRMLVDAAQVPSGARVLDVCTGTAEAALTFALHDPTLHLDGVDSSEHTIERARARTARRGFSAQITLEIADALDLPYSDGSFAIVCTAFALHNLSDPHRGVHEMVRVARRGGRVLVLDFCPPPRNLFGSLYGWYRGSVVPPLGKLLSGFQESYDFLRTSISKLWTAEEISGAMGKEGLQEITSKRLLGGIASLHVGSKP